MEPSPVEPRNLGTIDVDMGMTFALDVNHARIFRCEAKMLRSNIEVPAGSRIRRNRYAELRCFRCFRQNNDLLVLGNSVGGVLIGHAGCIGQGSLCNILVVLVAVQCNSVCCGKQEPCKSTKDQSYPQQTD